jgi:hypothetical protein
MLMVDADKIASALDYPRLVEALRIGHQRGGRRSRAIAHVAGEGGDSDESPPDLARLAA